MHVPNAARPAPIAPRSSVFRVLAVPLVSLLLLAFPASAAGGPALAARPSQPIHTLDADVLSADRIPTPKRRTGSSVTVITAEEIERKQYRGVVEALRAVPGLDVRQTGGPGTQASVFIRGTDSDHALFMVNGVEVNDPSAPSRGAFFHHLTMDNVERIEVIRGPQSTVWGSDAIGGVINVITKRGERDLTASGWAEGGSFSTARGGASTAGSHGPFVWSLAGSYLDRVGFSARDAGTEADPYRNGTVDARLGFAPNETFDVDFSLRHVDARIDFDSTDFPVSPPFIPFLVEDGQHTDVEQTLVRVRPELHVPAPGEVEIDSGISFAYSRTERNTVGVLPSDVRGEIFDVEWRTDVSLHEQTLSFGVESEWEQADSQGSFFETSHTLSGYGQIQAHLGEYVFGTGGVRVDDHSEFGREVTGRVAGGFHLPCTETTFRASFGTGFKAPSLPELNPSANFVPNPDLEPEESMGVDAGVEQSLWDGQVRFGATFFHTWIDDLIQPIFGVFPFETENVDEAITRGVETFVHLEPGHGVSFHGNYTYLDTEARGNPVGFGLEDGERLLRRPTHSASFDLSYRPPMPPFDGRAVVTLLFRYVGERIDTGGNPVQELDDYYWFGLTSSLRLTDRIRIFGRIDNLFDEDYQDVFGFGTAGFSGYGGVELRFP